MSHFLHSPDSWCWSSEGLLQCGTVQRQVLTNSTLSWAVEIWTFGNNQLLWVCFRDIQSPWVFHSLGFNKYVLLQQKERLFVSLLVSLFFPQMHDWKQGYERLKLQNCSSRSVLMLNAEAFMEWSIAKLASRIAAWGNGSGQRWEAAMPLSIEAP